MIVISFSFFDICTKSIDIFGLNFFVWVRRLDPCLVCLVRTTVLWYWYIVNDHHMYSFFVTAWFIMWPFFVFENSVIKQSNIICWFKLCLVRICMCVKQSCPLHSLVKKRNSRKELKKCRPLTVVVSTHEWNRKTMKHNPIVNHFRKRIKDPSDRHWYIFSWLACYLTLEHIY